MNQQPKLTEIMPLLNPIYPQGYRQLFEKVKLKIQKDQYTEQLNELIEKLIVYGQSNYTCWVAKKRILLAGKIQLQDEDYYCQEVLLDNLKNFQVWDYRNFIFEQTRNYERQYKLMDKILEISPKNYHLWSNRVKVVDYAKNYSDQIARTQVFIQKDIYNNSAWAYRFYCFQRANHQQQQIKKQINWVLSMIREHLDNEASWNYLRGFFPSHKLKKFGNKNIQHQKGQVYTIKLDFQSFPQIQKLCKQQINNCKMVQVPKKLQILQTLSIINSQFQDRKQYALQDIDLMIQLQPFRKNYYLWIQSNL